jgi:hypothetical protein
MRSGIWESINREKENEAQDFNNYECDGPGKKDWI